MQRAKLKFMNLFTTICVTRLRRDSGKERHYQASYSPPAGYALFQHSRAKRITRGPQENAAPPFGSELGPGTVGVWPEMGRKKADCRSRWKTFKPRLLARGKQKRPGRRFPAAAGPCASPSPRQAGGRRAGTRGHRGAGFGAAPSAGGRAPGLGEGPGRSPLPPCLASGRDPVRAPSPCQGDLRVRAGVGSAQGTRGWGRRAQHPSSGAEGRGMLLLEAHRQSSGN